MTLISLNILMEAFQPLGKKIRLQSELSVANFTTHES